MGGGGGPRLRGAHAQTDNFIAVVTASRLAPHEPDHHTNWRRRYHRVLRPVQHAHSTRVVPFPTARSALGARRHGFAPSKIILPSRRSAATPMATSWPSPGCWPASRTGAPSPACQPGSASWTPPGCPAQRSPSTFGCSATPGSSASSRAAQRRSSDRSSMRTTATAHRSTSCASLLTLRFPLLKKLGPLHALRRRACLRPRTRARSLGKTLRRQGKSSARRPFCPRSATGISARCFVPTGMPGGVSPTCCGALTTSRPASSGRIPTPSATSPGGSAIGSLRGPVWRPRASSGQPGTGSAGRAGPAQGRVGSRRPGGSQRYLQGARRQCPPVAAPLPRRRPHHRPAGGGVTPRTNGAPP